MQCLCRLWLSTPGVYVSAMQHFADAPRTVLPEEFTAILAPGHDASDGAIVQVSPLGVRGEHSVGFSVAARTRTVSCTRTPAAAHTTSRASPARQDAVAARRRQLSARWPGTDHNCAPGQRLMEVLLHRATGATCALARQARTMVLVVQDRVPAETA